MSMRHVYDKRENKPVMISLSKKLAPTSDIPFPAVTICPETKAKCNIINMTSLVMQNNSNFSEQVAQKVSALSQICYDNVDSKIIENIINSTYETGNVVELLEEMSPSLEDIFSECRFGSWRPSNCSDLFFKTVTDAGICFTFNMLNFKNLMNINSVHSDLHHPKHGNESDWVLQKDYRSAKLKMFPNRAFGAGLQTGLSVKFKYDPSTLCKSCLSGLGGFRVALHTPEGPTQIQQNFYHVPLKQETSLIIQPDMIYSSKEIKGHTPEKRLCYFPNERHLKFFKIYNKNNCDFECEVDYVLHHCGCVMFFMPRSNGTAVCKSSQLECAHDAKLSFTKEQLRKELLVHQLERDLRHRKVIDEAQRRKEIEALESCNCLPSCTSLKYNAEVTQTDYDAGNLAQWYDLMPFTQFKKKKFKFYENIGFFYFLFLYFRHQMAKLNIYFKDSHFSRLKRYEIYGWTDFLSNSGGILGLFMGCSVLSFIEIIYHVVVYFFKKCQGSKNRES